MADAKTCLRVIRESGIKIEMNVCKDKFNPGKEKKSKKVQKKWTGLFNVTQARKNVLLLEKWSKEAGYSSEEQDKNIGVRLSNKIYLIGIDL